MQQLKPIPKTLPCYQAVENFKVVAICGHAGTGKTEFGNYLYKAYYGPRLKTHINVTSKAVLRCENKANTLLWVDECHSIVETIRKSRKLGYKYVLVCSQAPGETIRRLIEAYGMPEGDYKIVDLSKVYIKG